MFGLFGAVVVLLVVETVLNKELVLAQFQTNVKAKPQNKWLAVKEHALLLKQMNGLNGRLGINVQHLVEQVRKPDTDVAPLHKTALHSLALVNRLN